jgi:hypothetical protein
MSKVGGMVGGICYPAFLYYKDFLASQAATRNNEIRFTIGYATGLQIQRIQELAFQFFASLKTVGSQWQARTFMRVMSISGRSGKNAQ